MNAINILAPEWRSWVLDNLKRGCPPESLVQAMVLQQFDHAFASSAVAVLARQQMLVVQPAKPQPDTYVYERSRIAAGNAIALHDRSVRIVGRLQKPDVVVFADFMTDEECDRLMALSQDKLSRSTVVDPETGQFKTIDDRSSLGTYFQRNENEFIARLDQRIAELMNWPLENGEGIQILRYGVGAEYKAHYDYFPESDPGSIPQMETGGQRVATLVMYLNDVERGGETIFPNVGMSVAPRKGSAVYFGYCNSLGQVDRDTYHAGAPVLAGEKWIATKWMRQRFYG